MIMKVDENDKLINQEVQRTLSRTDKKKTTSVYITIKLLKTSDKGIVLKAA